MYTNGYTVFLCLCTFIYQEPCTWSDDVDEYDPINDHTEHVAAPAEPVIEDFSTAGGHDDRREHTSTSSQYALLLKPFALLLLMIKNAYSLSDSCLKMLLLTMAMLIKIVGVAFMIKSSDLQLFLDIFPMTEHRLRALANCGCADNGFVHLVCCPKCLKLFDEINKWTIYARSQAEDFVCDYVRFPNHPHLSRRKKCASQLVQRVSTGVASVFKPLKVFPYNGLVSAIRHIIQRPDMLTHCNQWPLRVSKNATCLLDVYDGDVWKEFLCVQGRPFLSQSNTLALVLNVDWFRPFEQSQYSVGVIYFTILNLPREVRYLPKNIIVVGIIPGPKEPEKVMNTFLQPLVADLQALWEGIYMSTPSQSLPVRIRAALLCVSCDIPACRKVCGFLGHNANLSCSKCLCFFPGNVANGFDYSGYNVLQWLPRSLSCHLENAKESKQAPTATAKRSLESQHGARYSALLDLPYFDVVRQHVIDPMHKLFLGLAKHTVSIWKDKYWTRNSDTESIQEVVDRFQVPSDIGRIPSRISAGFSGFTADQWKHWTLLYSLVALKGRIPVADYDLWKMFVEACSIICSPVITRESIQKAHELLVRFCVTFQELYGSSSCTINMHLSCHLQQCIQDFGPAHTFWCFGFERMNGVLGSFSTNNRSIEVQLMRRYVDSVQFATVAQSIDDNDFKTIYNALVKSSKDVRGTANSILYAHVEALTSSNAGEFVLKYNRMVDISGTQLPQVLTESEHAQLVEISRQLFGQQFVNLFMLYNEATQLSFLGQKYGTRKSRLSRSSTVQAHARLTASLTELSVGRIERFLSIAVELMDHNTSATMHIHFADVMWLDAYPDGNSYPAPISIWYNCMACRSLIPVAFFTTRVAMCPVTIDNTEALVSVPLIHM